MYLDKLYNTFNENTLKMEETMKKAQQIIAIILVIVLLGLYITTFITSVIASPASHYLFLTSLAMTFVVPILLYVLFMFAKIFKDSNMRHINEQIKKDKQD